MYEELVKSLREKAEFLTVSEVQKAPPGLRIKNLFAETMSEAADAIEAMRDLVVTYEDRQRWIPVTEQYPEERKAVLVYQRMYKNTYCAFLEGMDWWIYGGYGTKAFGITHWKPLPEPPKEDI